MPNCDRTGKSGLQSVSAENLKRKKVGRMIPRSGHNFFETNHYNEPKVEMDDKLRGNDLDVIKPINSVTLSETNECPGTSIYLTNMKFEKMRRRRNSKVSKSRENFGPPSNANNSNLRVSSSRFKEIGSDSICSNEIFQGDHATRDSDPQMNYQEGDNQSPETTKFLDSQVEHELLFYRNSPKKQTLHESDNPKNSENSEEGAILPKECSSYMNTTFPSPSVSTEFNKNKLSSVYTEKIDPITNNKQIFYVEEKKTSNKADFIHEKENKTFHKSAIGTPKNKSTMALPVGKKKSPLLNEIPQSEKLNLNVSLGTLSDQKNSEGSNIVSPVFNTSSQDSESNSKKNFDENHFFKNTYKNEKYSPNNGIKEFQSLEIHKNLDRIDISPIYDTIESKYHLNKNTIDKDPNFLLGDLSFETSSSSYLNDTYFTCDGTQYDTDSLVSSVYSPDESKNPSKCVDSNKGVNADQCLGISPHNENTSHNRPTDLSLCTKKKTISKNHSQKSSALNRILSSDENTLKSEVNNHNDNLRNKIPTSKYQHLFDDLRNSQKNINHRTAISNRDFQQNNNEKPADISLKEKTIVDKVTFSKGNQDIDYKENCFQTSMEQENSSSINSNISLKDESTTESTLNLDREYSGKQHVLCDRFLYSEPFIIPSSLEDRVYTGYNPDEDINASYCEISQKNNVDFNVPLTHEKHHDNTVQTLKKIKPQNLKKTVAKEKDLDSLYFNENKNKINIQDGGHFLSTSEGCRLKHMTFSEHEIGLSAMNSVFPSSISLDSPLSSIGSGYKKNTSRLALSTETIISQDTITESCTFSPDSIFSENLTFNNVESKKLKTQNNNIFLNKASQNYKADVLKNYEHSKLKRRFSNCDNQNFVSLPIKGKILKNDQTKHESEKHLLPAKVIDSRNNDVNKHVENQNSSNEEIHLDIQPKRTQTDILNKADSGIIQNIQPENQEISVIEKEFTQSKKEDDGLTNDIDDKNNRLKNQDFGFIDDELLDKTARLGRFKLLSNLGSGSSGSVRLGVCLESGLQVAVKIIEKGVGTSRALREAALSALLAHPNVSRLIHLFYSPKRLFLVFQHARGPSLLDVVASNGPMEESKARRILRQLGGALTFAHSHGIVHRDVKVENVILSPEGCKLLDFGLANLKSQAMRTFCGSLYFAAPELLAGRPYEGPPIDVWSLGVVLFVLLAGRVPFDGSCVGDLQACISEARFETPKHLSKYAKALLKGMLTANPAKRWTLEQVLNSEWATHHSLLHTDSNLLNQSAKINHQNDLNRSYNLDSDKEYVNSPHTLESERLGLLKESCDLNDKKPSEEQHHLKKKYKLRKPGDSLTNQNISNPKVVHERYRSYSSQIPPRWQGPVHPKAAALLICAFPQLKKDNKRIMSLKNHQNTEQSNLESINTDKCHIQQKPGIIGRCEGQDTSYQFPNNIQKGEENLKHKITTLHSKGQQDILNYEMAEIYSDTAFKGLYALLTDNFKSAKTFQEASDLINLEDLEKITYEERIEKLIEFIYTEERKKKFSSIFFGSVLEKKGKIPTYPDRNKSGKVTGEKYVDQKETLSKNINDKNNSEEEKAVHSLSIVNTINVDKTESFMVQKSKNKQHQIDLDIPMVRKGVFRGIFKGWKVCADGSADLRKKIETICIKNKIFYEINKQWYICTTGGGDEEGLFKIIMYRNTLMKTFYIATTFMGGSKEMYKKGKVTIKLETSK